MHPCDRADEAKSAQRRHGADRAQQRHGATLSRGTRRAEIGIGQHDEGERVKRRRDSVVEFGADLRRLVGKRDVCPRATIELPEVAFAYRVFQALVAVRKPGQVEPIAVERHQRRIALPGLMTLHAAVLQHEKGAALVFHDLALLGQNGRPLLGVALVVDQDAEQLSVGAPPANVQRDPLFQLDETTGLHDVGDKIGVNFGCPAP